MYVNIITRHELPVGFSGILSSSIISSQLPRTTRRKDVKVKVQSRTDVEPAAFFILSPTIPPDLLPSWSGYGIRFRSHNLKYYMHFPHQCCYLYSALCAVFSIRCFTMIGLGYFIIIILPPYNFWISLWIWEWDVWTRHLHYTSFIYLSNNI